MALTSRVLSVIAFHEKAGRSQVVSLSFLFVTRFFSAASKLTTHHLPQEDLDCPLTSPISEECKHSPHLGGTRGTMMFFLTCLLFT